MRGLTLTAVAAVVVTTAAEIHAAEARQPWGVEVGARTGYALPFGALVSGTDLSAAATGVFPIWLDAGVRFPRVFVGAYLQYGWSSTPQSGVSAQAYVGSGGVRANAPPCGTYPFSYTCSGSDMKVGVETHYHLLPEGTFDPWLGFGAGVETMNVYVHGPFAGVSDIASTFSFAALTPAVLQAGTDFRFARFGVGPFAVLDLDRFYSVSLSNSALNESHSIRGTAWHEWLTVGVRGYFDVLWRGGGS